MLLLSSKFGARPLPIIHLANYRWYLTPLSWIALYPGRKNLGLALAVCACTIFFVAFSIKLLRVHSETHMYMAVQLLLHNCFLKNLLGEEGATVNGILFCYLCAHNQSLRVRGHDLGNVVSVLDTSLCTSDFAHVYADVARPLTV